MEINSYARPDRASLRDIRNVVIDTTKPCADRIRQYIEQIGNPYCYLDDGVIVQVGYTDTSVSLHERLVSYVNNVD